MTSEDLEALVVQRWEEDFQSLHKASVHHGVDPMPSIIECYREDRVVAALLPGSKDQVHDALRIAPSYGSTAVLAAIDSKFRAVDLDAPDEVSEVESAILLAVMLPTGENLARIYPYHVGDLGEVWHFDPIESSGALGGAMYESLQEGFEKAALFEEELGRFRHQFGLDIFEARVHTDCAVTKALVDMGIEVQLWSEPGSEEIILESFADYEPPTAPPPPPPPPSMN